MRARLKEGKYDEAGTHIGNFCENMVNILLDQMGEPIASRPSVGTFVDRCTSGNIGTSEHDSVRLQIPRTLRAAYDIRNNRDSVHVNLKIPVNHADTQAGIAMCSWMLAEILRVYGDGAKTDNMEDIGGLIDEISNPVTDKNPLQQLVSSQADFNREELLEAVGTNIHIVEESGEVQPGEGFSNLKTKEKLIVLMLGQLAAEDLGYIDKVGMSSTWFAGLMDVSAARIRQLAGDFIFVESGDEGYYIPQYRLSDAINSLNDL
jgi:hypothetical protein